MQNSAIDRFASVWFLVIPVTSFSLFPSIPATTPAYLAAFLSILVVYLVKTGKRHLYQKNFLTFFGILIFLIAVSQFSLTTSGTMDFKLASLVDYLDRTTVFMRTSIFTQSLYMITCIATFVFVKQLYREGWDRLIIRGAILLAIIGLFEVVYFILFKRSGDFISNRIIDGRVASLTNLTTIEGVQFLRLKSLTGEPGMFALTVLPYFIYSVHRQMKKTAMVLIVALILTTSGAAILGLLIYGVLLLAYRGIKPIYYIFGFPAAILVGLIYGNKIYEFISTNLLEKFNLDSGSGIDRFNIFKGNIDFFSSLNAIQKIFGIGFGTIRSTDLFSTVLVNNGILGVILFSALFLYPAIRLKKEHIGIKMSLVVVYIIMMISVGEMYYLPTWLFLGIAYHHLGAEKALFYLQTNEVIPWQHH